MKTVAVLGDTFLSGNVYGIQRYAYEILKQLDTIVKDIHIEIIVPEHFDVDCSFKNIKIVKFWIERIHNWQAELKQYKYH